MIRSLFRSFARKSLREALIPPEAEKPELAKALESFIGDKLDQGQTPDEVLTYMFGKEAINRIHESMNTSKPLNFADVEIKVSEELMQKIKPFMPNESEVAAFRTFLDQKQNEDEQKHEEIAKNEAAQELKTLKAKAQEEEKLINKNWEEKGNKKIHKEELKAEKKVVKENKTNKKEEAIGRKVEKQKNKRKEKSAKASEEKNEGKIEEKKEENSKSKKSLSDIEKRLEQLRNKTKP